MKEALEFLKELKLNNNREWFQANKSRYDKIKKNLEILTVNIISEIGSFDKDILTINPKECIFRIYRDVRFSHDKSPYKTNFGIAFSKGGKKGNYAGYYLHIEPDSGSFAGGGIWMPAPDVLNAIRKEIYYNSEEFKKILENKNFKKYLGELEGEKLVNPPKGFDGSFKDIELLKFKSYICGNNISDSEFEKKDFMKLLSETYKALYPLNVFLNNAINDNL